MPANEFSAAADALAHGGIIAFPTDTVFGIGARIDDPAGLERIFEAKGRDARKPLAVLCADIAQLLRCFADDAQTELIRAAAATFLPGPLTIVERKSAFVHAAVTRGENSVGVRIPDYAWCRTLLKMSGPLAVTSANRSGESPYTGGGNFPISDIPIFGVAAMRENGAASGIPSTVADFQASAPRVIRAGAITDAELAAWYARFKGQG